MTFSTSALRVRAEPPVLKCGLEPTKPIRFIAKDRSAEHRSARTAAVCPTAEQCSALPWSLKDVAKAEAKLTGTVNARNAADAEGLALVDRLVAAVKADEAEGVNSEVLEALG